MNSNDILVHHGIKGMKWGVRRTPEQLGYSTRAERKAARHELSRKVEELYGQP